MAPRLHVNIDHVATVRQARREAFPDPVAFAKRCEAAGASGITCHLRLDRRHIQDEDVTRLRSEIATVLNLECSLAPEILDIAQASGAQAFCLVPEGRQEVTTEGGMDVVAERSRLMEAVPRLSAAGGLVSLFIDPDLRQLDAAREVEAPFVELHTGAYAGASGAEQQAQLQRLVQAAAHARSIGLRVNAGHGLDKGNVAPVAAIEGVEELNIGFSLVAEALFVGVDAAVRDMLGRIGV
jgi:pyridoxine 5-phosphate synthase